MRRPQGLRRLEEGDCEVVQSNGKEIIVVDKLSVEARRSNMAGCFALMDWNDKGSMEEAIRWAYRAWRPLGPVNFLSFNDEVVLCLCPSHEIAMNITKRGSVVFKGAKVKLSPLERFSRMLESRSLEMGWIRVERLPLQLRTMDLFKHIGARFGGLMELEGEENCWMEREILMKVKRARNVNEKMIVEGEGIRWVISISEVMDSPCKEVAAPPAVVVENLPKGPRMEEGTAKTSKWQPRPEKNQKTAPKQPKPIKRGGDRKGDSLTGGWRSVQAEGASRTQQVAPANLHK